MKKAISLILILLLLSAGAVFAQPEDTGNLPTTENPPDTGIGPSSEQRIIYQFTPEPIEAYVPQNNQETRITVRVHISTLSETLQATGFRFFREGTLNKLVQTAEGVVVSKDSPQEVSFTIALKPEEIGTDIGITADYSYGENGIPDEYAFDPHDAGSFKVNIKEADKITAYEVTAIPDRYTVPLGGTINVVITVKNTGNTVLKDIDLIVKYNAEGSDTQQTRVMETITQIGFAEGDNSAQRTCTITNMGQNILFNVNMMFKNYRNEEIQKTNVCEQLKLEIQNIAVSFNIVVRPKLSAQLNGQLTVVYTIKNTGNTTISGLEIYNENNEMIGNPGELAPGQPYTGSTAIKVTADKTILYTYYGKDPDGNECTGTSNSVDITLEISLDDLVLSLSSQVSTTTLLEPGEVTFTITIKNKSLFPVNGVLVYDDAGELIKTIEKMETEGEEVFTLNRSVSESRNFFFKATVVDALGQTKNFESDVTQINIGEKPTASPTTAVTVTATASTPTATAEPVQDDGLLNKLKLALFVVAGLIVIAVAALIIMNIIQKNKEKKRRTMRRRIK